MCVRIAHERGIALGGAVDPCPNRASRVGITRPAAPTGWFRSLSDNFTAPIERQPMAKVTVEVLVDDLDGSEGAETVGLGWNGAWREIDLSKRNRASLSRALDRYWNAARPVPADRPSKPRAGSMASSRTSRAKRDPKVIRAWATDNGIAVPARGRIPSEVEQQYNEATRRK
jgi:hypothetical protein